MSRTFSSPLDVKRLRADFPILASVLHAAGPRGGVPLAYLDNAATTQRPRQVIQAIVDTYERHYANVHRGIHWLSDQSTSLYDEARRKVQAFINALVRTMTWMHKASLDEIVAMIPPEFFAADQELYRRSLAANLDGFTRNGELTLALAETTYRSVAGSGRLAGSVKLDIARTIEDSFWRKAAMRAFNACSAMSSKKARRMRKGRPARLTSTSPWVSISWRRSLNRPAT